MSEVYFVFNRKLYTQIRGLAIGYSTSGFTADIFMETIETNALRTFINPPSIWWRFVDDVYSNPKTMVKSNFLIHLNNQDEHIKWTSEEEQNGILPYIDAKTHRKEDGSLKLTVFRKPTHTDQYLNYQSNHHISHKLAVPKTLLNRADTVITDETDMPSEEAHIKKALKKCGYPEWTVKRRKKISEQELEEKRKSKKEQESESIGRIFIPYIKGTSEKIARELRKHNAQVIYMPTQKLKDVLCSSAKDKVPDMDKADVIYKVDLECEIEAIEKEEDYVGETKKATKHRMTEHHVIHGAEANDSTAWDKELDDEETEGVRRSTRLKGKPRRNYQELDRGSQIWLSEGNSSVSSHLAEDHEHKVKVSILGREKNRLRRGIKEAIQIKKLKPSLNKNDQDPYYIPHIYDDLIEKNKK